MTTSDTNSANSVRSCSDHTKSQSRCTTAELHCKYDCLSKKARSQPFRFPQCMDDYLTLRRGRLSVSAVSSCSGRPPYVMPPIVTPLSAVNRLTAKIWKTLFCSPRPALTRRVVEILTNVEGLISSSARPSMPIWACITGCFHAGWL